MNECVFDKPTNITTRFPYEKLKQRGKRITLNVGGRKFQTFLETLNNLPDTLLGSEVKEEYFDVERNEYFLDRDADYFRLILNYYRTGKLHLPPEECHEAFDDELKFYGIQIKQLFDCCLEDCTVDMDEKTPLDKDKIIEENNEKENPQLKEELRIEINSFKDFRNIIWTVVENTDTEFKILETIGTGFIFFVGFFIILSILTTLYETIPCTGSQAFCNGRTAVINGIDAICVSVFTFEYIIRLVTSPAPVEFVKKPMNIIDVLSIAPFYLTIVLQGVMEGSLDALLVLRVLRIFRVLKLSKNNKRLIRFGEAMVSCASDLSFLTGVLLLAVVLFASALYFVENTSNEQFGSIPDGMWFCVVTMITLGYGDIVPTTILGQMIASLCCLCGVILIALPVPIIQEKDIFKKSMLSVYNIDLLRKKLSRFAGN